MKRFLTTGFLGAFLGIVIGSAPADASLISRGFLDEVLTDYATTTALDLKADQTDLTALSNIVAKSAWNTENAALDFSSFPFTNEFGFKSTGSWVNNTRGIADMLGQYNANTAFPGLAGVTYKLTNGWTSDVGIGVRFEKYNQYNPGLEGMFNGWTIYDPSGSEIMVYKGLENISSQIRTIEDTYHTGLSRLLVNGENKINVEAYNYTGPIYPIWKLSEGIDKIDSIETKIGTLPSGEVYPITRIMNMYDKHYPNTHDWPFRNYPTSVQDLILSLYGPSDTNPTSVGFIPHVLGIIEELVWVHEDMYQQFGTLPTEYATVGAALTAIDAKIDARELPSTSDDGQYVLSAKKVGDTITYTWVKMDLTSEEQAQ